jgi:hypothetical protein
MEVVDYDNLMTCREQCIGDMAAYETGPSGNE